MKKQPLFQTVVGIQIERAAVRTKTQEFYTFFSCALLDFI